MERLCRLINFSLGPRLYRTHRRANVPGKRYIANTGEYFGEKIVTLMDTLTSGFLFYISPALLLVIISKTTDYASNFIKVIISLVSFYTSGIILRGWSRLCHPDYRDFYETFKSLALVNWLSSSVEKLSAKSSLMRFDFDFNHFPVEYISSTPVRLKYNPSAPARRSIYQKTIGVFLDIISYIAVQTFARRMLYPGSVYILQAIMSPMLQKGRCRLIERCNGERFKLQTVDNNHIDVILVNRRTASSIRGKTLVICCEGNAGFYEVGVMNSPLDAGYSVLGWNHPGFAGSTGLPFRDQEINAIDAVMKFALSSGFDEKNILLFGWSIGGFCASIAAMQYPNVAGLILDASFDDIIPLARSQMPSSWKPIVEHTIKSYFNLNVSENICHFDGPVLIIRRLQDEIIHTLDTDPLGTNRGNDLLVNLLARRFPALLDKETEKLLRLHLSRSTGSDLERSQRPKVTPEKKEYYAKQLSQYIRDNNLSSYPINFNPKEEKFQFVLFLLEKHLKEYDSTHCMPLPSCYCVRPWDIFSLDHQDTPVDLSSDQDISSEFDYENDSE